MRNSENHFNCYFIEHKLHEEANTLHLQTCFFIKQTEVLYSPCYPKQITWVFVPSQYIKKIFILFWLLPFSCTKCLNLYTSSWFSLQLLVAIKEIVNLTKPAFFLNPFWVFFDGERIFYCPGLNVQNSVFHIWKETLSRGM